MEFNPLHLARQNKPNTAVIVITIIIMNNIILRTRSHDHINNSNTHKQPNATFSNETRPPSIARIFLATGELGSPFPNHNQPIHLVITLLVTTVIDHHHSHTLAQGAGVGNRGKVFCFSLSLIYEWNWRHIPTRNTSIDTHTGAVSAAQLDCGLNELRGLTVCVLAGGC